MKSGTNWVACTPSAKPGPMRTCMRTMSVRSKSRLGTYLSAPMAELPLGDGSNCGGGGGGVFVRGGGPVETHAHSHSAETIAASARALDGARVARSSTPDTGAWRVGGGRASAAGILRGDAVRRGHLRSGRSRAGLAAARDRALRARLRSAGGIHQPGGRLDRPGRRLVAARARRAAGARLHPRV